MISSDRQQRARRIRRSLCGSGVGLLLLLAGMALGGLARTTPAQVFFVAAGFAGLIGCVRWSLALWDVDERVFEDFSKNVLEADRAGRAARHRHSRNGQGSVLRIGCLALAALLLLTGLSP